MYESRGLLGNAFRTSDDFLDERNYLGAGLLSRFSQSLGVECVAGTGGCHCVHVHLRYDACFFEGLGQSGLYCKHSVDSALVRQRIFVWSGIFAERSAWHCRNLSRQDQTASTRMEMPWPTPMHIVAMARFNPRRLSSSATDRAMRAPDIPKGCPREMAPPFTFT